MVVTSGALFIFIASESRMRVIVSGWNQ